MIHLQSFIYLKKWQIFSEFLIELLRISILIYENTMINIFYFELLYNSALLFML